MKKHRSRPSAEHLTEIADDYHERLARNWPEPPEQLHVGGWAATYELTQVMRLESADCVLDLCCGQGGTARWLAETYRRRVIGIDIVEKAVAYGNRLATDPLVRFVTANVFDLPFPASTFDVIYGQDPDGLAHHSREMIFRECLRVLRSGGRIGFQHWLLHDDAPSDMVKRYDAINGELGFPSMARLTVGDYVHDLKQAGFEKIVMDDVSSVYRLHMKAMERIADAREPGSLDAWTKLVLEIFDSGYRVGARIMARKPVNSTKD